MEAGWKFDTGLVESQRGIRNRNKVFKNSHLGRDVRKTSMVMVSGTLVLLMAFICHNRTEKQRNRKTGPLDGFGPNFADGVCGIRNRTQSFVDNPLGLCIKNRYTDFGFKTKRLKFSLGRVLQYECEL